MIRLEENLKKGAEAAELCSLTAVAGNRQLVLDHGN
jgi:hypothetical protein